MGGGWGGSVVYLVLPLSTDDQGVMLLGLIGSVQSLDRLGRRWGVTDNWAGIFQYFLREAIVSSSDVARNVNSLMFSTQH